MKYFCFISIILLNYIITDDDIMNYIIDNIYLGDSTAASNEDYLKSYNIDTVVNCAEELVSEYKDLKVLELKLYDDFQQNLFPKLEVGYKYIKLHNKNNILVHCGFGISRSASLVIFYIMKEKGCDFDTSFNYCKEKRQEVEPNSSFERQLKEYYDKYMKK